MAVALAALAKKFVVEKGKQYLKEKAVEKLGEKLGGQGGPGGGDKKGGGKLVIFLVVLPLSLIVLACAMGGSLGGAGMGAAGMLGAAAGGGGGNGNCNIGIQPVAVADGAEAPSARDANFSLPEPRAPYRQGGPGKTPSSVPAEYKAVMEEVAQKSKIPWYMLAAISFQETDHGRNPDTWKPNPGDSSQGPFQFTPPTWTDYGVDENFKKPGDIKNWKHQVYSAAHMLKQNHFLEGPDGVFKAIKRYNPHPWYPGDVLWWAKAYANGNTKIIGDDPCAGLGSGDASAVIAFIRQQLGERYVFGGTGPDVWDCSGIMWKAFSTAAGINIPRTAAPQADAPNVSIVMQGNIDKSKLQPGDLLFFDARPGGYQGHYSKRLGRNISHVAMSTGGGNVIEATPPRVQETNYDQSGRWSRVYAVGRVQGLGSGSGGGGNGAWARPVQGSPTSDYGWRTLNGKQDWHEGYDFGAPEGRPVLAVTDGTVVLAAKRESEGGGYGLYVVIDHGNGFRTGYAHNSKTYVNTGDKVKRGQRIADVGNTGHSFGAHLHFNVIEGASGGPFAGSRVDPKPHLLKHGVDYWS